MRTLRLQQHQNRRLQTAWNYAQIGLLALPLCPLPAVLVLITACWQTWQQQYLKIIHRPLNWGLAVLSIWLVITSCLAYDRGAAFLGLFNFLPHFLVFAGYSALIQTPAQLRQWASIMVAASVPVVMIGLGQLFLGWAFHFQFLWTVVDWTIVPTGNPPGRMSSVLMYANILAGYLVIIFSLGLGLWIEAYQTLMRGTADRKPSTWLWWGYLSLAIVSTLTGLILTDSRNAWAIAIFAALAFAVYLGWRWLIAGVAAAAGSILCAAFGPLPLQHSLRMVIPAFFWARLTDQLYPNRPVETLRKTQWQFAWSLTQQRPWTGWGLRNFTPLYLQQMHVWLGHPHSFLLMMTAETGFLGAILLCSWVAWIVVQSLLFLLNWPEEVTTLTPDSSQDKLIFFSYLMAFLSCMLFNTVDVTIFDARLNILGWLLLSGIVGTMYGGKGSRQ